MEFSNDADHIMGDADILATTEPNGFTADSLNPAQLALQVASGATSISPPVSRATLADGTHANGLPRTENENAKRGVKRDVSTLPKFAPLPYSSSRTGLVYDVRMRFHVEPIPKDQDMHPEDPRRIFEVYNELVQAGLVDDPTSPDLIGTYVLLRIPVRSATRDEILACHSQKSFDLVMSFEGT